MYLDPPLKVRCHDHEKAALLQFKQSFLIDCGASTEPFAYSKMKSWQEHVVVGGRINDVDCCTWEGVECDQKTNSVIGLHLNSSCIYDLQYTGLSGALPSSIGNLGSLQSLSINFFSVPFPIPSSLGNLTHLSELILSPNGFRGSMPSSLTNLTKIDTLKLSGIDVSSVILESWVPKLNKLTCLDLSDMNIGKKISSTLANLTGLTELDLESNQLFGAVPQGFANLTQLINLDLGGNQLEGPVQPWLSKLVNLKQLDLSDNKFDCNLEQLFELPNIEELSLANLNLTFLPNAITNYSSLPKLIYLDLSSCNVTEFPRILKPQKELYYLALDGNHIVGHVPQWFIDTTKENLLFLNLSSNHIVGFEQPLVFLPWTDLVVLDLKGNNLRGPLPIPSNTTLIYDFSNNHISGVIPDQICLANSLTILDLSNNSMSGRIPSCIGHKLGESLQLLNLRGNSFRGSIPQRFHKSCILKMINLSDNQLEGTLPRSLVNCTHLEVLDLGKNRVNDTFPSWLGTLNALQVLVLRHNKFHGEIRDNPKSSQAFGRLRIIDVSHNFHEGSLPSTYLQSWRAMRATIEGQSSTSNSVIEISYRQSHTFYSFFLTFNYVITISNKGSETLYRKILTVVRVVDFSSNNFTGEIPSFLGVLEGLQALNLSNNKLEGNIPSSLSKISDLESLDLSQNMLSGVIPQELNKLTFLEVFNVSHNRLVGSIPQGPQFNTFDNSSYDGNLALCGNPVSKKCGIVLPSPELPSEDNDGESEDDNCDWIVWVIGALGCASGFIVGYVIGKLYITDKYHVWFIRTFAKTRKTKSRRRNASNQRRNR